MTEDRAGNAGPAPGDAPAPSSSPLHPFTPSPLFPFSSEPLHVLLEDHHLLIVNKPARCSRRDRPAPSLEAAAKEYIKQKYAKPAGVYLGIPHRLDRPVSGVVCFARNTKAAQRVHAQFADHKVRKVYWALVEGTVAPDSGVWDDWVRKRAGGVARRARGRGRTGRETRDARIQGTETTRRNGTGGTRPAHRAHAPTPSSSRLARPPRSGRRAVR